MALVVVGSVAYDGVETPHGSVDRMLGGAATYISLAASYFTPVKLVGVVGDDFASEDAALLASRAIDLTGLERVPGSSILSTFTRTLSARVIELPSGPRLLSRTERQPRLDSSA
jgi:sugar/nucleoside kinase (ribokinase family)